MKHEPYPDEKWDAAPMGADPIYEAEAFVDVLRRAVRGYAPTPRVHGRRSGTIRIFASVPGYKRRITFCPITFVALVETGNVYLIGDWKWAVDAIGLSHTTAERIEFAADDSIGSMSDDENSYEAEIAAQLRKAVA